MSVSATDELVGIVESSEQRVHVLVVRDVISTVHLG